MTAEQTYGIYLHIPFCLQKCRYCDFYSIPALSFSDLYFDALKRNIRQGREKYGPLKIDTVFIGGGTPSAVDAEYITDVLALIKDEFEVLPGCEISIECNPATADLEKLIAYRNSGINRISFGMQSANDLELSILGRLHNFAEFRESFLLARKAGFDNINIDVMIGIPEQTVGSAEETLREVINLSPEHISVYMLKIEEGTPFFKMRESLRLPDEDTVSDIYLMTDEILEKSGYSHYEISNFAKEGYECRHNLRYWEGKDYLSFGTAAHSYMNSERFSYPRNIQKYINTNSFSEIEEDRISVTDEEKRRDEIIFPLRLKKGIPFTRLEGFDTSSLLSLYEKNGLIKTENGRVSLTAKGMLVSNYIISDILAREI